MCLITITNHSYCAVHTVVMWRWQPLVELFEDAIPRRSRLRMVFLGLPYFDVIPLWPDVFKTDKTARLCGYVQKYFTGSALLKWERNHGRSHLFRRGLLSPETLTSEVLRPDVLKEVFLAGLFYVGSRSMFDANRAIR